MSEVASVQLLPEHIVTGFARNNLTGETLEACAPDPIAQKTLDMLTFQGSYTIRCEQCLGLEDALIRILASLGVHPGVIITDSLKESLSRDMTFWLYPEGYDEEYDSICNIYVDFEHESDAAQFRLAMPHDPQPLSKP
jgi:hypothetical protein